MKIDANDNAAKGSTNNENSIWKEKEEVVEEVVEEVNSNQYAAKPTKTSNTILTIDPDDYVSDINSEAEIMHELVTAQKKKKKLHSYIDEVAYTPNGVPIVVTYYKDKRIVIPMSEMGIILSDDPKFIEPEETRRFKMASNMIGAEIDYIIKKIDTKTGMIFATRKEAVVDKLKTYYATLDKDQTSMVARQPRVEARIMAVNKKNLWVEVLGAQTQINAADIDYKWVLDLTEKYSPGDKLLVNVEDIVYPEPFENCDNDENWLLGIKISAEHKSFEPNIPKQNFEMLGIGNKCSGVVTDFDKGKYMILLRSGVNAVAHNHAGNRKPMIGDTVSFACLRKNENTFTAEGLITKVISSTYR